MHKIVEVSKMTLQEQFQNFFKLTGKEKDTIVRAYKNLQNGQRVQVYNPGDETIKFGTANRGNERTNRGSIIPVVRIKLDGEQMAHEIAPQAVRIL
jgi:hypothetical protein